MAISTNTPLPVPGGWALAKHIKKGDWLYNPLTGLPTQVKLTQTYTPREMYRITTRDGVTLDVDKHANIPVQTIKCRERQRKYKGVQKKGLRAQRYATPEQMLERGLKDYRGESQYAIRITQPIQWATEDFPVPPYIVGMWMTRRNKNSNFIIQDSIIDEVKKNIKAVGWGFQKAKNVSFQIRPSINTSFLTKYAKIPVKLPLDYQFGSVEQRIELLRGLVATKPGSYNPKKDMFTISSRDIKFLMQIQGVLESLGIKTVLYDHRKKIAKDLFFQTDIMLLPWQKPLSTFRKPKHRIITSIEKIDPVECIHIETDTPFVAGSEFTPIWH